MPEWQNASMARMAMAIRKSAKTLTREINFRRALLPHVAATTVARCWRCPRSLNSGPGPRGLNLN